MPGVMPLDGVRVIDLTWYNAGPFCTRVLADYGADVIKVEPTGGDPARLLPPHFKDKPGLERSGLFLFLNTNKRSAVLDLKSKKGHDSLLELVRDADAVVENFSPGTMERLGLGYEALRAVNPRVVLTSITNFGQDGPYRDWQGMDLTLYAMGGPMYASGEQSHEPLKVAGRQTSFYTGIVGALATMVAMRAAGESGQGEHVDISIFETATHSIDLRLARLMTYQFTGRYSTRPPLASNIGGGVVPCADGWYMLGAGATRLDAICDMMGQPELLDLPEYKTLAARVQPGRAEEFMAHLLPWTMAHTKKEILAASIEHGVMGGPINTIADMLEDPNFVERQFFQQIDHPTTGPLTYPGYHFQLRRPDEPMPPRRRAPLLGEHTDEVLAEARERAAAPPPASPAEPARPRSRLPLEGVRILDFTVVLAGPYSTMQLADWGAEVIRVESLQHFAPSTRGQLARPPQEMIDALANGPAGTGYADGPIDYRAWNRAAAFNAHGRGKLSMTVDLGRPEGQQVFERLIAMSDGLIENNLPPNIEKQGVTWDRLSKINPRLVMLRIPGFGIEGPYRSLRSMGHFMEAIAGHPAIRTYSELSPEYIPLGVPSDAASGMMAAFAFMCGLRYRDLTGDGLFMEQATAENFVPLIGDFVLDYTMNQRLWSQMGNDHMWLAPHNVYRCRGGDQWVTLAVRNEEDWRALCGVLYHKDLLTDPRFDTNEHRYEHRRELDAIIGEWASHRDARWIMQRLQAECVPAGLVMNEADAFEDRHLQARGFFQPITHPETGTQLHVARAWRTSADRPHAPRHAPLLGEDNEYVYKQLLGFSDEEYRHFEEIGHIGMEYDPSVA
jgi:crotonobetainyl-CoA:carnitine CoA-transferase CaiB-like acyl-CoA transferase